MKKIFVSDCEGPISKNDNAFETTAHFVPKGDKLFTAISGYDDVLADALKRPGHRAGSTLKLVLPFLKAYGVTNKKMREFSAKNLVLISNAKETLQHARSIAYSFIVSTSYEHYIKALCLKLNFNSRNTYCTRVNIDKYPMPRHEKEPLKKLAEEIAQMPPIAVPHKAKSLQDFSTEDQKIIKRLDDVFLKDIAVMRSGEIYSEVNPLGGSEKAEAIKDVVKKVGARFADVIYVGDSITDEEAFKLVRENDGLTISFNGNQYAIENAEIAVLSENSTVIAIIADAFCKFGKKQSSVLIENWSSETLKRSKIDRVLLKHFFKLYPAELPKVKIITSENMKTLARESSEFRKTVRGRIIGGLG